MQPLSPSDVTEWLIADKAEENALIDEKEAIKPVEELPLRVQAVGMKAVSTVKLDGQNQLDKRKRRWVVFGNKQTHGLNYENTHSPCTQLVTLRVIFMLSLVWLLEGFALDVITCFLNSQLDTNESIFVTFPDGRTIRGCRCGRLLSSVHGLKQAPRVWYYTSKKWLLQYDDRLRVSSVEPCLFYIWLPPTLIVLLYVHVDDYFCFTDQEEWRTTSSVLLGRSTSASTRDRALTSCTTPLVVAAYKDADHAADKVTRQSVTGSLVTLNGGPMMFSSKLQKTVALSGTDAEPMVLTETARDAEYCYHLLSEIAVVETPMALHGDNHASVYQAENALNNSATRHLAVRCDFFTASQRGASPSGRRIAFTGEGMPSEGRERLPGEGHVLQREEASPPSG
ncbi:hypothetical protein CYMTET_30494 [Cymbomonas tetramitiformis]|uniref:Reverse transcriptase Ty1/copia-type domain-containing protein n=1 Tax=Cymbomonas tetramitiformis TaxID=36881 RepID=A0AAE0KU32_9CHLO|nr:hypothetical protein CYMTET_30494 [Cymbomonas tetramitiformis]